MVLRTVNLEAGIPTVDEARRKLMQVLREARAAGVIGLKLIHGYGSTGVGGKLRQGIRTSLLRRKKEGVVSEFIFGERWDIFDSLTQRTLQELPELRRDPDLQRSNPGITIVLLKSIALEDRE